MTNVIAQAAYEAVWIAEYGPWQPGKLPWDERKKACFLRALDARRAAHYPGMSEDEIQRAQAEGIRRS